MIFVSIASYCDDLLSHTIKDAIKKAKNPQELRFGVVEQNYYDKRLKITPEMKPLLRYVLINPKESRGACWARSICMSLYGNEDWFFQIDSHMVFDQDWDAKFIHAIDLLRQLNPKILISSYPSAFVREGNKIKKTIYRKTLVHVVSDGAVFGEPTSIHLPFQAFQSHYEKPVRGIHLGAGCIFTLGKFVQEVPYDPFIYFNGEEQSLALRAFTHGYDIYHIPDQPVYHLYTTDENMKDRPKHWDEEDNKERQEKWHDIHLRSAQRLLALFSGQDLGAYGVGRVRSLHDYIDFTGIDYLNRRVGGRAYTSFHALEKNGY